MPPQLLPLGRSPPAHRAVWGLTEYERSTTAATTRCSVASGRGGSRMATLHTRTAGRAHSAHWRTYERSRERSRRAGPHSGFPAWAGAIGLDRWPQRSDRDPMDLRHCRGRSQTCGGISRACARRHPQRWQLYSGGRCCRRPTPYRSFSCTFPTQSPPASSTALRGRAATPPGSPSSNTARAENGWSSSKRSCPA